MRNLKLWTVYYLLFLLTACATVQVPQTPQEVINEANIYLTATAQQVTANVKDRLVTHKEAQGQIDDVKRYREQLDNAQKLLDAGDITNAKTQADILHAAVLSLRQRVFAKRTGATQ